VASPAPYFIFAFHFEASITSCLPSVGIIS
jgi:hypothetical protein